MKKTLWVCAIAGAIIAYSGSAQACDKHKADKAKDAKPTTTQKKTGAIKESRVLTGSYIKRDVNRYGQITDGPSQVLVIDSEAIRRSGAQDVRQILVRRGGGF